jgi:hypothetical protein
MQVLQKGDAAYPHAYALVVLGEQGLYRGTGPAQPRKFGLELIVDGKWSGDITGGMWCNTQLQEKTWYHLAATYNGNQVKLYLNGQLDAFYTITGSIETTNFPVSIGYWGVANADYFNGLIDEVQIFNRALSDTEIVAIYNAGSAGNCKAASITGGGIAKTDCLLEWLVTNPDNPPDKKGFPSAKQSCMDGDPSCDFDTVEGKCTFHMATCLNVDDPRLVDKQGQPLCTPSDIAKVDVTKADPLQGPLVALGGQAGGQCTNKGKKGESCQENADCDTAPGNGKCQGEFVFFDPPLDTERCTEEVSVVVPLKVTAKGALKQATLTLKTKATTSLPAGEKKALTDTDSVQLSCLPGEP